MNKLAVIIPFYKRHDLTKLCFDRIKRQSKKFGFDVIVAGSEGDESKKLAKGLKYIETENRPLGKKLNDLLKECKDYDGVIIIGSDNFMSDSIIKEYQKIDCTKQVYYCFDDIFVYSAKYKELRSDFDYTRNGNGIGVARLFTKPTLKKMNYEVWSNDRLKGLDGDADRRLKAKKIKEVKLELDKHLLIDVKVQENISAHEMIFTGHKEHDLSVFKKLGKVGEKILQLECKSVERLNLYKTDIPKKRAFVKKSFNGYREGIVIELKEHNYKQLLRAGFITPFPG